MTQVGKGAKLEDSNISAYGSKEHKDARLNAAKTEAAWEGAGKKVGTEIWRIEKFKVVAWPKEQYGKFYDGDAYVVLNTYVKPDNKDKLLYNVHFWLGSGSSQDEQGVAAYKTVELDDLLGDLPVQYREVQGSESDAFLAIFNNQISLLKGGIESGFKKVEEMKWPTRLLHIKGTKNIRVTQVANEVKALNNGDSFILDMGLQIFQWNGKSAGIAEKRKAASMIENLKKERNGKAKSAIIDGIEENKVFWEALGQAGGAPPAEASIAAATSDDIPPPPKRKHLFELSDKTGSLVKTKVAEGSDVKKSKFSTDEVFILDVGEFVYAWIGKGASKQERSKGIEFASNHVKESGLPDSTPVSRVMEGAEPAGFLAWL